jgi:hypothetical protein
VLHAFELGAVSWYGNSLCTRCKIGQGVKRFDCGIAGSRFPRCNVDFRSSCLEKPTFD